MTNNFNKKIQSNLNIQKTKFLANKDKINTITNFENVIKKSLLGVRPKLITPKNQLKQILNSQKNENDQNLKVKQEKIITENLVLDSTLNESTITKKSNNKTSKKIVILILTLLLSSLYFWGVMFFSSHYLIGTKMIGVDIALKKEQEVQKSVLLQVDKQSINVLFTNNKSLNIKYENVGVIANPQENLKQIMKKQNKWLWFLGSFNNYKITKNVVIDHQSLVDKYTNTLKKLIKYINVYDYIKFSPQKDKYVLTNDKITQGYIISDVFNQISEAIKIGNEQIQVKQNNEIKSQLNVILNKLNKILQQKIVIKFGDKQDNIESKYIAQIIKFTANGIEVDRDLLASTLQAMAKTFQRVDNQKIYVYNSLKLLTQIKSDLETFNTNTYVAQENILPLGKNEGQGTLKLNGTYIEVNISAQEMYVWKDSNLVKTFSVVTGEHTKARDTPLGVWEIWNKQRNKTLKGSTVGVGSDYNYEIPVKYWMPIDDTGVGLHSIDPDEVTSWHGRVYWGKDAYLTNRGSHGCVNMHTEDAAFVFDNIPLNTKVYVTP